ncbi:MAG: PQQ-binding-like beta-propeller repeat protein [Gemmataceae bacterium]
MSKKSPLRRCLAFLLSLALASFVVLASKTPNVAKSKIISTPKKSKPIQLEGWRMFGGTPQRNMVQPNAKNLPVSWDLAMKKEPRVKWRVQVGSRSFGAPVIAEGKIFVGTNNEVPRDPNIKGDRGILMCFRE